MQRTKRVKYSTSRAGGSINGIHVDLTQVSIPSAGEKIYGTELTGVVRGFNVAADYVDVLRGRTIVQAVLLTSHRSTPPQR